MTTTQQERTARLNASGQVKTSCHCGIEYSMPKALHDSAVAQPSMATYCPLGHAGYYSQGKTRLELEQDKVTRLQARLDRAEAAARDEANRVAEERKAHAATKGKLTKTRNRAAKGICPVPGCKRSFVNVARHVATCHPEHSS